MRAAPLHPSCLLLPGPFAARRDVKGAQAGGGKAEKSQRLFVLKPSSIFLQTSAKQQQQCHWWEDGVIWGMLDSAP